MTNNTIDIDYTNPFDRAEQKADDTQSIRAEFRDEGRYLSVTDNETDDDYVFFRRGQKMRLLRIEGSDGMTRPAAHVTKGDLPSNVLSFLHAFDYEYDETPQKIPTEMYQKGSVAGVFRGP